MLELINELNYKEITKKQKDSITKLFPTFKDRVRNVGRRGGVRLEKMSPKRWHFRISSGTHDHVSYIVSIQFENLNDEIRKAIQNPENWVKAKDKVNQKKLAGQVMFGVDLKLKCSCPADNYWGGAYIRTKQKAKYGMAQNKAPDIRNPQQHGEYCKHTQLVMEALPFYGDTFIKFLKKFYKKLIDKTEKEVKDGVIPKATKGEPDVDIETVNVPKDVSSDNIEEVPKSSRKKSKDTEKATIVKVEEPDGEVNAMEISKETEDDLEEEPAEELKDKDKDINDEEGEEDV